jgi:S-adenosylmethionine:tRNA ribosyltransferase-isomerase
MQTSELDYDLPPELIAQAPLEPRDASRLMVIDRASGAIRHHRFADLEALLRPRDWLVANDSRVIPARIAARKPTGGRVEILLLRKLDDRRWQALVGGRRVSEAIISPPGGPAIRARVLAAPAGAPHRVVEFDAPIEPRLASVGEMPIPPYIHQQPADPERYQTVYARIAGSAAAPTAGLHFTPRLLGALDAKGVGVAFVTLHIGLDTFKPIAEDTVEAHRIHTEWCDVPDGTAQAVREARAAGGRCVAVGTTSARALESAAQAGGGQLDAFTGFTSLYIMPGYRFAAVDAMITNFHLPRSTLLAMVGAFTGLDLLRQAYAEAVRERYRFYSFGDAMLIV